MRHFIQYFNPDKVGRDPDDLSDLSVFTNKYLRNVPLEGSVVWLVTGKGRPRRYRLGLWFVVTAVEAADHLFFLHRIRGEQGHIFRPQTRIDGYPWFPAFRRAHGNFAFGLTELAEPEAQAEFLRLAAVAGAPAPR